MKHVQKFGDFRSEPKINESHEEFTHYMFFQDVESIKRMCDKILAEDFKKVDQLLANGHDWAADHVAQAKSKIGEVTGFLMNELGSPAMPAVPPMKHSHMEETPHEAEEEMED